MHMDPSLLPSLPLTRAMTKFYDALEDLSDEKKRAIVDALVVVLAAVEEDKRPPVDEGPDETPCEEAMEPISASDGPVAVRPIKVGDRLIFPGGVVGIIDRIVGSTIHGHDESDGGLAARIEHCRLAKDPIAPVR